MSQSRSCCRFWSLVAWSRVKRVNSHGNGAGVAILVFFFGLSRVSTVSGRHPRDCGRFWPLVSFWRVNIAIHRDAAREGHHCHRFWTLVLCPLVVLLSGPRLHAVSSSRVFAPCGVLVSCPGVVSSCRVFVLCRRVVSSCRVLVHCLRALSFCRANVSCVLMSHPVSYLRVM